MTDAAGHPASMSFVPREVVRERCRAMHMPTWHVDTGGTIVEEPEEAGLIGLWLRSPQVQKLIEDAAATWSKESGSGDPQVMEAAPGCWLIPVLEERRRRKAGMTIAMALGPGIVESELFRQACRSLGLDDQALRVILKGMTIYDGEFARQTTTMLRWMSRDMTSLGEYQDAVRGFTTELTQSYETIDLLYALGRSMHDLPHPEKFLHLACERLFETLPFQWMAVRLAPEDHVPGAMAEKLAVRGKAPASESTLAIALRELATQSPDGGGNFLTGPEHRSLGIATESRMLVQPIARPTRSGELTGMIICGDKTGDDPQVSSYDMQLMEAAAAFTGAFLENSRLYREQQALFMGSLKALTSAIDAKDRYTCGHSERVALLASRLAQALGLDGSQAERVHICGLVHDVGKIGVPESVLMKPGKLTDEEFAIVKLHPEIGHRIIRGIPIMDDILGGVLHHHERWDGRGYPHGIAREEIPLFARLIGLADTFDAMSSTRSYRGAVPRAKVLEEIAGNAGTQFDPELTQLFLTLDLTAYDLMVERHSQAHGEGLQQAA
jgi:HD-GYP domain-containing protein (c-di-GMP phosphodiesterase class II)